MFVKVGDTIALRPTGIASNQLHAEIARVGDVTCEVLMVSEIGVCTIALPEGVTLKGFSTPSCDGRHYVDLHKSHLKLRLGAGSKVNLTRAGVISEKLRREIARFGEVIGEVTERSRFGICSIRLPEGVTLKGFSVQKGDDHYLRLHESHLALGE
jgi:hypothetical protein